jgi:hypothetical protein
MSIADTHSLHLACDVRAARTSPIDRLLVLQSAERTAFMRTQISLAGESQSRVGQAYGDACAELEAERSRLVDILLSADFAADEFTLEEIRTVLL